MRFLPLLALVVLVGRAEAGVTCEEVLPDAVTALERLAKDPKSSLDSLAVACLPTAFVPSSSKKVQAQIESACTKILARDGAKATVCLSMAVRLGKLDLGGVAIRDAVLAWKLDPWQYGGVREQLWVLTMINDNAAATEKILETWHGNEGLATKRAKHRAHMANWSSFRQDAATMIGMMGTRDQLDFLRPQAATTKDKFVKAAIVKAIKAIESRIPAP